MSKSGWLVAVLGAVASGCNCGDPVIAKQDLCADVTCPSGPCVEASTCDPTTGSCATRYRASGTVCRAATGPCDAPETCSGAFDECPADAFAAAETLCRPAAGSCDAEERCDGTGPECPADAFAGPSVGCRPAAGPCDRSESCDGTSAACPADGFQPSTTLCRAAAGPCDAAESCSGHTPDCPADSFEPPTRICRAGNGPCDVTESCTGASAGCPADAFAVAALVCRGATGPCDVAESCTGTTAGCPDDAFATSQVVCRGSAGACDLAELCTGTGPACPADAFKSTSEICRPSTGSCDLAESCTGSGPACPQDGFEPMVRVCRASSGDCDVAETCPGNAAGCPADAFESPSKLCRASSGSCDLAETCSGSAPSCPADTFEPSSKICRAAAGSCDVAERCSGKDAACPADAFAASTTVCRDAAGPCDVAETCSGSALSCPSDALAASSRICRAAADSCDVDEVCSGSAPTCPADAKKADAAGCEDGVACTTYDYCLGGVCRAGSVPKDADGDGHADSACAGGDCNDDDRTVNPWAVEGFIRTPAALTSAPVPAFDNSRFAIGPDGIIRGADHRGTAFTKNGSGWLNTAYALNAYTGIGGLVPGVAVDSANALHVCYLVVPSGTPADGVEIWYATDRTGSWVSERVASSAVFLATGSVCALGLGSSETPVVLFGKRTGSFSVAPALATRGASAWTEALLNDKCIVSAPSGMSCAGGSTAAAESIAGLVLQASAGGELHAAWQVGHSTWGAQLQYARFSGGAWATEPVSATARAAFMLHVEAAGVVHLVTRPDAQARFMHLTRQGASTWTSQRVNTPASCLFCERLDDFVGGGAGNEMFVLYEYDITMDGCVTADTKIAWFNGTTWWDQFLQTPDGNNNCAHTQVIHYGMAVTSDAHAHIVYRTKSNVTNYWYGQVYARDGIDQNCNGRDEP